MLKKHLLIDMGHLSHRFLFSQAILIKEIGYDVLRHSLLVNGLFPYINQFGPNNVYIGVDYKKSWRKEETAIYKANREEARKKSSDIVDWNAFYSFMEKFIIELKTIFPFYTITVPTLEADDIIGWLAANLPSTDEKIIISGDGDYMQLLKHKNTKWWNSNKRKYIDCKDPEKALLLKIICGDTSDNIPGVRRGLGPVRAEKFIDEGKLEESLSALDPDGRPCEFRRNFDRNKKLIDLSFTPNNLISQLKEELLNYNKADGSMLFRYIIDNKLREMLDNIDKYRSIMAPLICKD